MTETRSNDPLKDLQLLLLQETEDRIAQLEKAQKILETQINDREGVINTLSPVIADLLSHTIRNSGDEIASALSPVMSSAIKKQIKDSRDDVVDALYPIIGRMISKAISEAMKSLVASVNENINRKLDISLWFKKIKARLTGVDLAEMLIADGTPCEIQDVFLISRQSGLLIAHINKDLVENSTTKNNVQIIAGMLTAIKSFIQDAFQADAASELREIEYSNKTIRIEPGRYTFLAIVYSGIAPLHFNEKLTQIHTKIHERFHKKLREYNGDNSSLYKIEYLLKEMI